jgi:hypothetical protein
MLPHNEPLVVQCGDQTKASSYDASLKKFKILVYGWDRLPGSARSEVVLKISPIAFRNLGCDVISNKINSVACSPQANYTDRAIAVFRRS